jgi:hypothetical protein
VLAGEAKFDVLLGGDGTETPAWDKKISEAILVKMDELKEQWDGT